ncbi:1-phosphatidylinositol 4:5-bisphosphate phosphodiesterase gamma-1-like protein, partial [Leptotrombidium deliense]
GIEDAERLINEHRQLGDGTFLIRDSNLCPGKYTLSYLYSDTILHTRIDKDYINGCYVFNGESFDDLIDIVQQHKKIPFKVTMNEALFNVLLGEAVPQPMSHESQDWFHLNIDKNIAEIILLKFNKEGVFLVRPSSTSENHFVISFRFAELVKHFQIKRRGRRYIIDDGEFCSLEEIIEHYKKYPFYNNIKLGVAITRNVVEEFAQVKEVSTEIDSTKFIYTTPSEFTSKITVKAVSDFVGRLHDELTFRKNDIIRNVVKHENNNGFWTGDFGGKNQCLFPSSCVADFNNNNDNIQWHREYGIHTDSVTLTSNTNITLLKFHGKNIIRITNEDFEQQVDVWEKSDEIRKQWIESISDTVQSANKKSRNIEEIQKQRKVAKELSDLIVYCRAVPYNPDKFSSYTQMSSLSENSVENLFIPSKIGTYIKYHRKQFSRIFPKGSRFDSSNYDPIPMWNCGSQMVALNYQTGDKFNQINRSKFMQNGNCGYVLKPQFLTSNESDFGICHETKTLKAPNNNKSMLISIELIAGTHLVNKEKTFVSPVVEIEIIGLNCDNYKFKSKKIDENGLNPVWMESFPEITVECPELAFIRFVVNSEDLFGDASFVAQATYPLNCLRNGFRSVSLRNTFSEEIDMCTLLIKLSMREKQISDINGVSFDCENDFTSTHL